MNQGPRRLSLLKTRAGGRFRAVGKGPRNKLPNARVEAGAQAAESSWET